MRSAPSSTSTPSFPALVQAFFTQYLVEQRAMSPRTVATYRDAFVLFLAFAQKRLRKLPCSMSLADLTPELILAFLDYLEKERHNSVHSRNNRLAALRAFLKFAGRHDVSSLHIVECALGVPMKRFERPVLGFLTRKEMLAVIGAPGATWTSQRDHLLLGMLYNTGARVSEIIGVRVGDLALDGAAYVHLRGKGRKQRAVSLWPSTAREIRAWLRINPQLSSSSPLLPNRDGHVMTRVNVTQRLRLAVRSAARIHPDLAKRRISPHTIRHTTAMHLLQSGIDVENIALWLGHERPTTTHMYVEHNLAMKQRALAKLQDPNMKIRRYRPPDSLLHFLTTL
jgi:site-specific recombinase XerD